MKVSFNKKIALITAIVLLVLGTVGTTLAYIFIKTDVLDNGFDPVQVSCAVVENDKAPATSGISNIAIKENVRIKNTGDISAYIRATVVITWKNEDGSKVFAASPAENTDYKITYSDSTQWSRGSDGYYYFADPVPSDELTEVLISSVEQLADGPMGSDGTQYYLSVEILASAIQSTPEDVVADQWGVSVNNGKISK